MSLHCFDALSGNLGEHNEALNIVVLKQTDVSAQLFEGVDVIKEALLTAKHAVNDEVWQLEFKMIAPPNYKCEVITHSKVEGEAKLREALKIIKEVMKRKGGHFK